jgi:hypothetical protein
MRKPVLDASPSMRRIHRVPVIPAMREPVLDASPSMRRIHRVIVIPANAGIQP